MSGGESNQVDVSAVMSKVHAFIRFSRINTKSKCIDKEYAHCVPTSVLLTTFSYPMSYHAALERLHIIYCLPRRYFERPQTCYLHHQSYSWVISLAVLYSHWKFFQMKRSSTALQNLTTNFKTPWYSPRIKHHVKLHWNKCGLAIWRA